MVKRIFRNCLLALPLVAGAGVAQAADAVIGAPAPAPTAHMAGTHDFWNGFYIGGLVGYHTEKIGSDAGQGDGALGGVYLGYNLRLGQNVVVGVEGDYAAAGGDGYPALGMEMSQIGSLRGRIGYAMDRIHFYATGGYAYSRYSSAFGSNDSSVGLSGYTVGGGIDYMVTQRVSARLEYLYMNFSDTFEAQGAPSGSDTTINNYRAGMAFHF